MGLNVVKSVAFAAPLAGLALLMASGERSDEDVCPGNLALEKSRQLLEGQPGVVDLVWSEFKWTGCRVGMQGYADVETAAGYDRRPFEIVIAFDPGSRRWQQVSLDMTQ